MPTMADRLKELGADRGRGWQAELARHCGVKPPSVADWLTGKTKALEGENLLRAAEFFGVRPTWLVSGKGPKLEAGNVAVVAPNGPGVRSAEDLPFLPGFEGFSVPMLTTSASMGGGAERLEEDYVVGRLTVSPQWIAKTIRPLSKPENLRFIHGYGDSMEPTFSDGDILLVDVGARAADIDGIYVLGTNDRLFIKRVTARFDGVPEITSDNPRVKTVQALDGTQQVEVLGRVVYAWNGKKL